jgi:hypothetical protein
MENVTMDKIGSYNNNIQFRQIKRTLEDNGVNFAPDTFLMNGKVVIFTFNNLSGGYDIIIVSEDDNLRLPLHSDNMVRVRDRFSMALNMPIKIECSYCDGDGTSLCKECDGWGYTKTK